jgi:hypothetical protein
LEMCREEKRNLLLVATTIIVAEIYLRQRQHKMDMLRLLKTTLLLNQIV